MIQNEEQPYEVKENSTAELNTVKKQSETDLVTKSLKASFKQKSFLGEGDEGNVKVILFFFLF